MISKGVLSSFPNDVRRRGAEYWVSGAVTLPRRASDVVDAGVLGTHIYSVRLVFDGSTIRGSCACPYFPDNGACKHLWATLLAVDRKGWLDRGGVGPGSHAITDFEEDLGRPFFGDLDETEDLDPSDDGSDDHGAEGGRGAATAPDHWTRALATIDRAAPPASSWLRKSLPEGAEIVYAIDLRASRKARVPVLVAAQRRRLKDGSHGRTSKLVLTRGGVAELPKS